MRVDVLVLGGGIVGTSMALDLALRGRSVALIDRGRPGAETSFGNAGLIQSEAVMPYAFPRDPLLLLQYALNLKPEAHYHIKDLFKIAPFLLRYFMASNREGQLRTARANAPIFGACLAEHRRLAEAAGAEAMLRPGGWLKVFRKTETMQKVIAETEADLAPFGVEYKVLDKKAVQVLEPHLSDVVVGGLHWTTPYSLNDPEALTLAYARKFEALGGRFLSGNAMSSPKSAMAGASRTEAGQVTARIAWWPLAPGRRTCCARWATRFRWA